MRMTAKDKHTQESKETLLKVIFSNLFSLGKIFLVCAILVYLCVNYGVRPIRVLGDSMYPTLKKNEFGFSNAFAGRFLSIERQDIVVFYDYNTKTHWIKRVIGLPGDSVYAKDDVVYVNGKALDEPYLDTELANEWREFDGVYTKDFASVTLKEDEYFLLGDSRTNSQDSRVIGPVKRSQIRGVDIFVALPFSKMRIAN